MNIEHAQPSSDEPVVAGPQAETAVVGEAVVVGGVLDGERQALLTAALNRIVPARENLPGAGDLGVGRAIVAALSAAIKPRRLFLDGLTEIDLTSQRQHGQPFTALDSDAQDAVLRAVEEARPGFFAALVDHAYRGYYLLPVVHAAIGHESRPPQPLGHHLPLFEPALLERQRAREPFWRRTT